MENLYNFLKVVTNNGELIIQYNKDYNSKTISYSLKELNKKIKDKQLTNIHFCTGLKEKIDSRKMDNFKYINRFVIDIDLKKQFKKEYSSEMSNYSFLLYVDKIIKTINKDERFSQRTFVVVSGNGLHIHYVSDTIFELTQDRIKYWKEYINYIFLEYDKLFGDNEVYFCDKGLSSVGHLCRLPETINYKNGIKNKCYIYDMRINRRSNIILNESHFEKGKELFLIRQRMNAILAQALYIKKPSLNKNIFQEINDIDITILIQKLIPERKLAYNRRNFYSEKNKKVYCPYYVMNNKLFRGGSSRLPGTRESFNCFSLIKDFYGFTTNETIDWFKHNILK